MDLPILLGVGLVYGPIFAGLVGLLGAFDLRELRREISLSRAVLNRAQVALSAMLAASVFAALGGELGTWPLAVFAAIGALAADCVANHTIVALATSLLRREPFTDVLGKMYLGAPMSFIAIYACFGFLGLLLAETYIRLGILGVGAFVAPVILARQVFNEWRNLNEARSSLRAKSAALRLVDERIADERRDERVRIAASLHDEVLQCLYNVTIRTHVIKEDLRLGRLLDLDDDVPPLLDASERAVEELRDVIRDLRKSAVGHAGLIETLGLLLSHLRDESGVTIVPDLDESLTSDASTELLIYQIAREALTNAVKHASPTTIWITLRQLGGSVSMAVVDDGIGFDTASFRDDRHFGLELMKERASMLGGELLVSSHRGSGTTVSLVIEASGTA
jgi:signal transduction histidine kinase